MHTPLTVVTRTQGNNADLKNGTVVADGLDLRFVEVPVLVKGFRRMVRDLEFDVCEMALTTYLCAKEHGVAFTALPIFLVRGLHHEAIVAAEGSGLAPSDLQGRRVAVNRGYTVTTGVWARGILERQYGVDLETVTWVPSGDEHVASYRPPANVDTSQVGIELRDLVREGRVDAAVGVTAGDGLESVVTDPYETALTALRTDGLYPINHLVVVRDELLHSEPTIGPALFEAFTASKQRYLDRLRSDDLDSPTATDRMHRDVADVLDGDPLPYGIDANRDTLERLVDHAVGQRIVRERPHLDDLFAPETLHLTA